MPNELHAPDAGGIALMPAISPEQLTERFNFLKSLINDKIMAKNEDYGDMPGAAGGKPALLKPGAEKLAVFFGLSARFAIIEKEEDWTGAKHGGEPFFYYRYSCALFRGTEFRGNAEGSCNSWERKYRWRARDRICPGCGMPALIPGKPEYEKDARFKGGWICYHKKGGCGAKFTKDDERIGGQPLARVVNPDAADVVNTIQKIAQKRAFIGATLVTTAASQFFTQDFSQDYNEIDEMTATAAAKYAKASGIDKIDKKDDAKKAEILRKYQKRHEIVRYAPYKDLLKKPDAKQVEREETIARISEKMDSASKAGMKPSAIKRMLERAFGIEEAEDVFQLPTNELAEGGGRFYAFVREAIAKGKKMKDEV